MELNPNNKVLGQVREHWHKIAAIILLKLGKRELQITPEDVFAVERDVNIVLDARGGELWVRLVDDATAVKLARREGGMPSES